MGEPTRDVSPDRKAAYYLGMGLMGIGFLVFLSNFFVAFGGGFPSMEGMMARALIGMGLIVFGAFLRSIGARGLAGSGVVLDPQQARRDVEPWSRMAGGMLQDAVEEAGLKDALGAGQAGGELPFDEKLRRLEKLRQDGLITESEYRRKREEILAEDW
ncbi:MAG TPA: SHOCT domain-containing protein [Chloroflexi bacterium]|nr:SHOCT domain-containing protein [Chloroflexota bacterium]HPO58465.1 SHOCT domain-containing protein [Anaerolineaceae bacterium]